MKKNRIRLTESQLHNIIKESVKQMLSELDWKTYDNAARKKYDQWAKYYWRGDEEDKKNFKSYERLKDAARDAFDRDYGYSDEDGYLKTDINNCCSDERIQTHPVKPNGHDFETHSPYFVTNQNFYGQNGQHEPGKWCVGTVGWAGAVAASPDFDSEEEAIAYANDHNMRLTPKDKISDKLMSKWDDANKELDNFYKHNYEYEPNGRGWHLKDNLDEAIHRAIRKALS